MSNLQVFSPFLIIRDCVVPVGKRNHSIAEIRMHVYDNYNVYCVKVDFFSKVYLYQHAGCVVLQKTIHSINVCHLQIVPTSGAIHMTYSITYNTALSSKINSVIIAIHKSNETITYRHSPGIKPDTAVHSPAFNCVMIVIQKRDLSPFIASLHYQMRMKFKVADYLVYHMMERQEAIFPVHTIGQVQFHLTELCTGPTCRWSEVMFKFEAKYFRHTKLRFNIFPEMILNLYIYSDIKYSQIIAETTRLVVSTYEMFKNNHFIHTSQYFGLTNISLQLKTHYEFLKTTFYSRLYDNTSYTIYMNFGYTFYTPIMDAFTNRFVRINDNKTVHDNVLTCSLLVSVYS